MIEDNMYLHGHIILLWRRLLLFPSYQLHWVGEATYTLLTLTLQVPFRELLEKGSRSGCFEIPGLAGDLILLLDGQHLFFFPLPLLSILIFFPSISVSSSEREGAINVSNCVWLASEEENVIVALLQQILKDVSISATRIQIKKCSFSFLFLPRYFCGMEQLKPAVHHFFID